MPDELKTLHREQTPHRTAGSSTTWFYGRYSCDLQKEDSIDQQLRSCRVDAATHDHVIEDDWVFGDESTRGADEDRPQLNRLMDLIRQGDAKCTDLYIFDTSRLARDISMATKVQKFFDFRKVRVHYVANGMVSGTSTFNLHHAFQAAVDQQFSKTLGANVKRGHIDHFEKGYVACARCYGYTHFDDIDPAFMESFGRKKRKGVKQVPDPTEAAVVRKIFSLYVGGMGYDAIARHLNASGIRSPRKPHKNTKRCWGTSAIRTILANPRYVGRIRHGVTETSRDPDDNKVKHRRREESEWHVRQDEALRIVSDEDFEAVQRIRKTRDTLGSRRKAAGLNKAKGIYIWSGLLLCGECGGSLSICQGDTYMCSTANRRGGCGNKLKLNRQSLERDLTEFLVHLALKARSFEQMVDGVMRAITKQQTEAKQREQAAADNHDHARTQLATIDREISGLVSVLTTHGFSEALSSALREREASKKLLTSSFNVEITSPESDVTREKVAEFLSDRLSGLADILLGDPRTCRDEMRRRVQHLTFTPSTFEGHAAYDITGDIQLFQPDQTKMLGCNRSINAEHFTVGLTGAVLKLEPNGKIIRIVRGEVAERSRAHRLAA